MMNSMPIQSPPVNEIEQTGSHRVLDFAGTMSAIEQSLTVRLIMTGDLITVSHDQDANEVFTRPEHSEFDCFPVRDRIRRIIGVVYRRERFTQNASIESVMAPLSNVPIIASSDPIEQLLRLMRESDEHHWLVLHDAEINGIVTRSDLDRLPVRLLMMARLVHLEQLITDRIRSHSGPGCCIDCLVENQQGLIKGRQRSAEKMNESLELVHYAGFREKLIMLREFLGDDSIENEEPFIRFRNNLMHAKEQSYDHVSATELLRHADMIDRLIGRWSS